MSKTTTNQNETLTETGDMLQEDQEFLETENIDEAEKVSEEVHALLMHWRRFVFDFH